MKYIFDSMEVPGAKVPAPNERVLKVLLSPELGSTDKFTLLFSIISPGNTTGLHTHDVDEIMYVVTGRGECIVGEEKGELKEDTVLFAPKLVKHEVKNVGDETLKLVCFYVPPMKPAGYFAEATNKAKEYFKGLR
jgi:mannose-6-phosphate isomerase-like protein (cupin superfamily)